MENKSRSDKRSSLESENDNLQPPIKDKNSKNGARSNNLHNPFQNLWNHFFDFFMLFLAVFCGFMADNWREQISEHQREKTYIRSIIEDIKSDTLESGKILSRLITMHKGIDSVLVELTSPEVLENSNKVYHQWTRNLGLEVFVSNDRTIEQLKNSGDLRLIRNETVSDGIMKYDQAIKKYNTQSNMMYNAMADMTYYIQLFDFMGLYKYPDKPVPITDQGKNNLNQAFSHLDLWNRALTGLISWLKTVNDEGKSLLVLIKKEYS
jgi:hypothetical protein